MDNKWDQLCRSLQQLNKNEITKWEFTRTNEWLFKCKARDGNATKEQIQGAKSEVIRAIGLKKRCPRRQVILTDALDKLILLEVGYF